MTRFQYLKDVATLELDIEKCIGCGRCVEVCPHGVFTIVDGKALIGKGTGYEITLNKKK